MKVKECAVVVLASGLSQRFNGDKLLADLAQKPVLQYSLNLARALHFQSFYALLPSDITLSTNQQRREICTQAGFQIIENPSPAKGQTHALWLVAHYACTHNIKNLCVLLADMPCVSLAHMRALLGAATPNICARSKSGAHTQPPLILTHRVLKRIARIQHAAQNTSCLPKEFGFFEGIICQDITLSPSQAEDIDTRADLTRVQNLVANNK